MPNRPDTTTNTPPSTLTYYPAYCYRNSPTWFTWVKLTCFEVHYILRPRPTSHQQTLSSGPNSNLTLFYHNHPIQYLQVIGLIVAVDDTKDSLLILTLDDSSGSVLDVVVRKPRVQSQQQQQQAQSRPQPPTVNMAQPALTEEQTTQLTLLSLLRPLQAGTLLRVKGTLTTFRNTRQLTILRANVIHSTAEELTHISARTAFNTSVLSKPWVVSRAQQEKLLRREQGERVEVGVREQKVREKRKRAVEREKRHAAAVLREWEGEERIREAEADAARRDGQKIMRRLRRTVAVDSVSQS